MCCENCREERSSVTEKIEWFIFIDQIKEGPNYKTWPTGRISGRKRKYFLKNLQVIYFPWKRKFFKFDMFFGYAFFFCILLCWCVAKWRQRLAYRPRINVKKVVSRKSLKARYRWKFYFTYALCFSTFRDCF